MAMRKGETPVPIPTRRFSPKRRGTMLGRHGRVAWLPDLPWGCKAQLGEHCLQAGVKSSNLFISTRQSKKEVHPNNKEGRKRRLAYVPVKTAILKTLIYFFKKEISRHPRPMFLKGDMENQERNKQTKKNQQTG